MCEERAQETSAFMAAGTKDLAESESRVTEIEPGAASAPLVSMLFRKLDGPACSPSCAGIPWLRWVRDSSTAECEVGSAELAIAIGRGEDEDEGEETDDEEEDEEADEEEDEKDEDEKRGGGGGGGGKGRAGLLSFDEKSRLLVVVSKFTGRAVAIGREGEEDEMVADAANAAGASSPGNASDAARLVVV